MMKRKIIRIMLGVASLTTATATQAVTWQAGQWTLGIGGNINVYYAYTQCDNDDLEAGGLTLAGLACAGSLDEDGEFDDVNSVTNGLLPSSLNISAATTQSGWDISANVNVYYGSNSNTALSFSTVDARQVYLTFGKEEIGTFRFGRDFGLFAYDAIINDMSLLGLGGAFSQGDFGHTSLGGLGFGYVYTDRLAQMNYTTPDFNGFQATIGIFNPLDGVATVDGFPILVNTDSGNDIGWHGKLGYTWGGEVRGTAVEATASTAFLYQTMDVISAGEEADVFGWDIFAQVSFYDVSLLGYYYLAEGMSTLAIGGLIFPGFDGLTGDEEEIEGYMLQATYSYGNTKFGINWSYSEQNEVTEVENQKLTLGVYHNLTTNLALVGEFSYQTSDLDGVGEDETSNINLGTILFF